jgi:hypothetical protein
LYYVMLCTMCYCTYKTPNTERPCCCMLLLLLLLLPDARSQEVGPWPREVGLGLGLRRLSTIGCGYLWARWARWDRQ